MARYLDDMWFHDRFGIKPASQKQIKSRSALVDERKLDKGRRFLDD